MSNFLNDSRAYIFRKLSEIKSDDLIALSGIIILLIIIILFLTYDSGVKNVFYGLAETFTGGKMSDEATKAEITNIKVAEDLLSKTNKTFVIVFHDKQCGHCSDFLQTNGSFEKFVQFVRKDQGLYDKVIIRITGKPDVRDFIEKKLPFSIDGYPTIVYVKQNEKKNLIAKELEGSREATNLLKELKMFQSS